MGLIFSDLLLSPLSRCPTQRCMLSHSRCFSFSLSLYLVVVVHLQSYCKFGLVVYHEVAILQKDGGGRKEIGHRQSKNQKITQDITKEERRGGKKDIVKEAIFNKKKSYILYQHIMTNSLTSHMSLSL